MPLDPQTATELSRAAANVRTWTEKRNNAIRAAHAVGGGIREIARATGLNVATVSNIITPRRRT
jgi:DNA invertase Pin-like site-specific DNA recombinase